MKRLLDIVVSGTGLLLLAPVLLLIALAVRLDSPGPALYRQVRVGQRGRHFEILKFRSMRAASEGPQITVADDRRITRIGTLLRATKLDELPQLVNVLRGDMSLVGPRPEVPRYVALYPPEVRAQVLSVRPGMTDEAAIEFRDEAGLLAGAADPERTYVEEILPRKLELYRSYVGQRSLGRDLRILWRTLLALLRPPAG